MSDRPEPRVLPPQLVEMIFEKLVLTYGQEFLRRWLDVDLELVKQDWAHELAGCERNPRGIVWALENLPEGRPPTVLQFRALWRRAPQRATARIENQTASREFIRSVMAKTFQGPRPNGQPNRNWVDKVLARHAAGQPVSRHVLAAARDVAAMRPVPPTQPDEQGAQA